MRANSTVGGRGAHRGNKICYDNACDDDCCFEMEMLLELGDVIDIAGSAHLGPTGCA